MELSGWGLSAAETLDAVAILQCCRKILEANFPTCVTPFELGHKRHKEYKERSFAVSARRVSVAHSSFCVLLRLLRFN
jgi:hypothetical protein